MAVKLSFFLLLLYVLLSVISSASDGQPLIDQAQEKLDDMTLSMRNSGYGLSASILHANLKRFIHECGFMRSNITIFAPRNEAMNTELDKWYFSGSFPVQILTDRVEEEDFLSEHIVKGTYLTPCERMSTLNVTEHPKDDPGRLSIGNARVLHWNIYRDDLIVVHGVDSFFDRCVFPTRLWVKTQWDPWISPWETESTFESIFGFSGY